MWYNIPIENEKRKLIMFRIPEFFETEMNFKDAAKVMESRGRGDLLAGMESMDQVWTDYCASDDQDDDQFFTDWGYECSAYNVVFENMSKLFK